MDQYSREFIAELRRFCWAGRAKPSSKACWKDYARPSLEGPQPAKGRESPGEAIMKPINCLVTATVAVALAVPVQAQVDCADWNTAAFFKAAEVSDVTRCLQADGNLKARDGLSGFTPLHFAARSETGKAVTALLEAGADPNARTEYGYTPLHPFGGAVREARDGLGTTPLHWARTGKAVTALLEAGANLKAREGLSDFTPLFFAARSMSVEAVTALLGAGADPNARDESGHTPLHQAALSETGEAVTVLLEAGADPNARDGLGNTPLHSARTVEAVTALLGAGADPNARDAAPPRCISRRCPRLVKP